MDQLAAPELLEPTRSQSCTYCFVVQQTLDEEAEAVLEAEADWEAVGVCAGCLGMWVCVRALLRRCGFDLV